MSILLKKYLWVLHLFVIALCAYFSAKIVTLFIADKLMVERKFALAGNSAQAAVQKTYPSFDQYRVIVERNIFDSRDQTAPVVAETQPTEETPANLDGPAVKTSLPIKLLSTFSVGAGQDSRSTATIQGTTGAAEVYTVNDAKQFASGAVIKKILQNRIEFVNGPRLEYAEIENLSGAGVNTGTPLSRLDTPPPVGAKPPAASGGKLVVDQAELDNALANLDKIFTEVRVVPNFVGGKPAGIRLLSMTPTSIFGKLGMQRGDVLERINGVDLDMKTGFEIFNRLKGEKKITVDLVRNGQKQTLDYEIR